MLNVVFSIRREHSEGFEMVFSGQRQGRIPSTFFVLWMVSLKNSLLLLTLLFPNRASKCEAKQGEAWKPFLLVVLKLKFLNVKICIK